MLVAKTTVAAERGVQLVLSEDSRLAAAGVDSAMVLTIAGNLIDNAIDAAAAGPRPARVTVRLTACDGDVMIEVADSGPGVPDDLTSQIFTDGFTTKAAAGGATTESGSPSCTASCTGRAARSRSTARAHTRSRCACPPHSAAAWR